MEEKVLLAAVLLQALRDACGVRLGADKRWDMPRVKRQARRWFLSNEVAPFTFLWIASHLDIEPGAFRRKLFGISPRRLRTSLRFHASADRTPRSRAHRTADL